MKAATHPSSPRESQHPWWQVMCLTGLDYFSTLGYQPSIAFVAAGLLSPLATLLLVAFTFFGALTVYWRVAEESPHGEGSLSLLTRLYRGWKGKLITLVVLGFMATDFIITITLSAADGATHFVENPFTPPWLQNQLGVTLFFILLLGFVFYLGFREAITVAVGIVLAYLLLNAVVVAATLPYALTLPKWEAWWTGIRETYLTPQSLALAVVLAFPKLALGLSGFETGVAVMPLVKGCPDDPPEKPRCRIRNTRKLLVTAASIMGVLLLSSAWVTTVLIPPEAFKEGGPASGRALAYLAHHYLGEGFGTLYDLSTILILWFAGGSAMAGLLTLVPRYLPRYGMAPEWAKATRVLTIFLTSVAIGITLLFKADVNAQAAAYATGVLVLMTSAAWATYLLAKPRHKPFYGVILALFLYTLFANTLERPDGVKIASFFVAVTLLVSLVSRTLRAYELRVDRVILDELAQSFLQGLRTQETPLRLIAHHRRLGTFAEYVEKETRIRDLLRFPLQDPFLFVEVGVLDPSEFSRELRVRGVELGHYRILRTEGTSVPNALAALLLYIRDETGTIPRIYFEWPEISPMQAAVDFLLFGEGDVPTLTREVLRRAEPNPGQRPLVYVGGP